MTLGMTLIVVFAGCKCRLGERYFYPIGIDLQPQSFYQKSSKNNLVARVSPIATTLTDSWLFNSLIKYSD